MFLCWTCFSHLNTNNILEPFSFIWSFYIKVGNVVPLNPFYTNERLLYIILVNIVCNKILFPPVSVLTLLLTFPMQTQKHTSSWWSTVLGETGAVTTCSSVITGADGGEHLCALSSKLPLIGQKLDVSCWPQTTGASWCEEWDLLVSLSS